MRVERAERELRGGLARSTLAETAENLLGVVAQLLDVAADELRLLQHAVTAKYGFAVDVEDSERSVSNTQDWGAEGAGEQPLHQDFGNNTLLTPARGAPPAAAAPSPSPTDHR